MGRIRCAIKEILTYLASLRMVCTKQNLGYYSLELYFPISKKPCDMHMNTYIVGEVTYSACGFELFTHVSMLVAKGVEMQQNS